MRLHQRQPKLPEEYLRRQLQPLHWYQWQHRSEIPLTLIPQWNRPPHRRPPHRHQPFCPLHRLLQVWLIQYYRHRVVLFLLHLLLVFDLLRQKRRLFMSDLPSQYRRQVLFDLLHQYRRQVL
eukprot:Selendium_serpulae@DN5639_c0_g1_i3.p1